MFTYQIKLHNELLNLTCINTQFTTDQQKEIPHVALKAMTLYTKDTEEAQSLLEAIYDYYQINDTHYYIWQCEDHDQIEKTTLTIKETQHAQI